MVEDRVVQIQPRLRIHALSAPLVSAGVVDIDNPLVVESCNVWVLPLLEQDLTVDPCQDISLLLRVRNQGASRRQMGAEVES